MNHLDDKTKIMSLIIKQLGFVFIASMVDDTLLIAILLKQDGPSSGVKLDLK